MHDGYKGGMTVAEALADRAAELTALVDWAAVRLNRARGLAVLAKGLASPAAADPYGSAAALDLAGRLVAAVGEEAGAALPGDPVAVEAMALRAKEALLSGAAGDWHPAHVASVTVAELAAALPAPAAEKVATAES